MLLIKTDAASFYASRLVQKAKLYQKLLQRLKYVAKELKIVMSHVGRCY